MVTDSLKINLFRWLPVGVIGILLIISLTLLYLVTRTNVYTSAYVDGVLYLNGFMLLLLSAAILLNLTRIIYQWHTRQAGSRFTLRLMAGFLALTLLPVVIVSFFSMNFIGKNISRQLDGRVERALGDALELSEMSLAIRSSTHLQQLSALAGELPGKNRLETAALIDDWRAQAGAFEAVLFSEDLSYVANSTDNLGGLVPLFSANDLMNSLSGRNAYYRTGVATENGQQNRFSRVALRLRYGIDEKPGILTALFYLTERERSLAENVLAVRNEYKEISFGRTTLKKAFRVALLIIVVLTVLFALWAAFIFSRRLTQPVRDLVEGTLAVASGDLQKKLPVSDRDDFSLLARSFNTMTKRLSNVQQEREQARNQLQQEHDYLDVVLGHLSSGVVTLDEQMIIRRANTSADQILRHPLQQQVGRRFSDVCHELEGLKPFLEALQPWLQAPQNDWQSEVELAADGQRKLLICRGASLPNHAIQQQGYVLVFEDVTDVVQAEHDAAWGEVARRLAHEIKNPLTPIQLSAERLARKLSRDLDHDAEAFLSRMTGTIIQQVDTLKSMVNAFSEYAKAPALVIQQVDLNKIIADVAELYRGNEQGVVLKLVLEDLPVIAADPHRMRQLLVNLLKNALEAISLDSNSTNSGEILISSHVVHTEASAELVVSLQDSGPGIPEELLPKLFEPYVTSKRKGTGLGLAIVKKIVEEHDGRLSARNAEPKGAIITITLPLNNAGSMRGN
ncbi:MAG: ATP-binding protein [Thiolinea sp.]